MSIPEIHRGEDQQKDEIKTQTQEECVRSRVRNMIELEVFLQGAPTRDPSNIGGIRTDLHNS